MARFRALPYAKALYEVVRSEEPGRVEEVVAELEHLADALEEVPSFAKVLTTPMVSPDVKGQILDEVLDALGITQLTRRFVHVVQRHYRMQHMRDIAQVYREQVDRALGRTRAKVEVAGQLDGEQRQAILAVMRELLDSDVVANFIDNRDLLAGFRVRVGSKVYDGSLAGQVDRLSREMQGE